MKYQSILFKGMAVIASLSLACSCNTRLHEPDPAEGSLSILPSIEGATLTKATEPGDDDQRENTVVKLDVFVNGEFSDNTSWRVYHLDATKDRIEEGVNTLLNQNWRTNGYTVGKTYNVYVAANSPKTQSLEVADLTSTAVLQNLIHWDFDPEEDSQGGQKKPYWPDGTVNPEWLNIHKSYVKTMPEGSNPGRVFTTDKDYLMDGYTTFTPDASVNSQVIPVSLDRVASKIVVKVKFDAGFLAEIKTKGLEVTGAPGWRFFNFAYNAPVFDPAKTRWTAPEYTPSVFSAGALLLGNATYADTETKDFQISTYSYPRSWEAGRALMDAPAINISIGYKKGDKTSYNYYRIPVVEATTTEIGRNKIYKVTATIASMGSTLLDENIDTKLQYEVLDWNDTNDADVTSVDYKQSYYLQVSPSNITLRGNGTQDVNIKYSKPAKQKIGILYFPNQAAAEAEDYQFGTNYVKYNYTESSPAAYYYNKDKNYRTTFNGSNVQKSISDNNNGTIAVSSEALLNKAIKYIKIRVYLDVDGWEAKKLYKDVIIKHYPTDNIQSIEGLWSSRTAASGSTVTETEYSYDPVADGWGNDPSIFEKVWVNVGKTEKNGAKRTQEEITAEVFRNVITDGWFSDNRESANSEENAILGDQTEGWYYWGEDPTTNGASYWNNDYSNWGTYYRYQHYYRVKYQKEQYKREVTRPADIGWVDWERDNGKNTDPIRSDEGFDAHIFDNGTVHRIGRDRRTGIIGVGADEGASYSNNHMYVVQISSTSDKYVIGRPVVDETTHQSLDDVVSPAFMIGSQLGIVSRGAYNARTGATHCATYMEVAEDGTRYTGWRLPTEKEIGVIVAYQGKNSSYVEIDGQRIEGDDRAMEPVLTGANYYNLSGSTTSTGYTGGSTGTYLRCVRDLTPQEIAKLNQ